MSMLERGVHLLKSLGDRLVGFSRGRDTSIYSMEQRMRKQNYLESSTSFVQVRDFILDLVGESADFYFVDQNDEEVDVPELLALIKNPFFNYTDKDLIQQFALQRIQGSMCLIKLVQREGILQQQIISNRSIREVKVTDEGRVAELSDVGLIAGQRLIYLDRPATEEESVGALSVKQGIVDGWNTDRIAPSDFTGRLQTLVDTEVALQEGGFAAATEITSPKNLYVFDDEFNREKFAKFLEENKGNPIASLTLTGGDVKRLSPDFSGKEIAEFSEFIRRSIFEAMGVNRTIFDITTTGSKILYEAVLRNMYSTVVDPELQAYVDLWNRDVQDAYPVSEGYTLKFRDTFPEETDVLVERLIKLVNGDIFTVNEAREQLEKEALEGADRIGIVERDPSLFIG